MANEEEKDIEVVEAEIPAIADDRLIAIAEAAEKRIEAVNKIKRTALKVTNPHDWTSQNDRPYLQVSGSEKVARLFGLSWRIDEPVFESAEGGHFSYTYKGYFTLGGTTIEAIGTRSSKDGFFKKYGRDMEGKKIELPPSEIDKGDVKKAAYTNLLGNGISRLLGIRNLTWDDLKAAGVDIAKIAKVEYKKEEMSDEGRTIRAEAHEMLLALYGENYGADLEKLTAFTAKDGKQVPGKKALDGLSEAALAVTHRKIKELYEKHQKAATVTPRNFEADLKNAPDEAAINVIWNEIEAAVKSGPEIVKLRRVRDTRAQELKGR